VLAFCLCRLFVSHLILVSVVRWLGGSFAKLGFSVGFCGFAYVPPIRAHLNLTCKLILKRSSSFSSNSQP
jgi:hypothetical protein